MSWPMVALGEISQQIRGVTYQKSDAKPRAADGYEMLLRANNITDDGIIFEDVVYVPSGRVNRKQVLAEHDIVIAASSGSLKVVGKSAAFRGGPRVTFGAFCKAIRPDTAKVDPRFFSHVFRTPDYRRHVERRAAGANINNLRNEDIAEYETPLPPLEEQRRIAGILDAADALRRRRREALALLDTLPGAIFAEMFGDPFSNPQNLQEIELGSLFNIARGGSPRPIQDWLTNDTDGLNWVKIGDASAGTKYITQTAEKIRPEGLSKTRSVKPGDFVLTNSMSFGRPYIMGIHGCIHDGWLLLSPAEKAPKQNYLYHLLSNAGVKARFAARAPGSTVKNLNIEIVSKTKVPIADTDRQEIFEDLIEKFDLERERQTDTLRSVETLFDSLQSRAFAGEL